MKKIMAGISLLIVAFCGAAFACSYYWLNNSGELMEMFRKRETVVGVIFEGSRHDGGWNETLMKTFEEINDKNCRFVFMDYAHSNDGSFGAAVDKMVSQDQADIIFSMGVRQPIDMAQVSDAYPNVKFYTGYGERNFPNVCGLFVRMYQAQYQAGMLAASETKTGDIAIVAPLPQPVINTSVNALALGIRRIRPDAKIHMIWTNTFNDEAKVAAACERVLSAYPVDVVTQVNPYREVLSICRRRGIKAIGMCLDRQEEYGDVLLGTVIWKSEPFIRNLLDDALEGRFTPGCRFASIDENMRLLINLTVRGDSRSRIENVGRQLRYTNRDVFYGPVKDNRGNVRIPAGYNLSDQAINSRMDWYVEGISVDDEWGNRQMKPAPR